MVQYPVVDRCLIPEVIRPGAGYLPTVSQPRKKKRKRGRHRRRDTYHGAADQRDTRTLQVYAPIHYQPQTHHHLTTYTIGSSQPAAADGTGLVIGIAAVLGGLALAFCAGRRSR